MSDAPDKKATPLKDFYAAAGTSAKDGPKIEIKDIDDILEPSKSQEKKKRTAFKFKKQPRNS